MERFLIVDDLAKQKDRLPSIMLRIDVAFLDAPVSKASPRNQGNAGILVANGQDFFGQGVVRTDDFEFGKRNPQTPRWWDPVHCRVDGTVCWSQFFRFSRVEIQVKEVPFLFVGLKRNPKGSFHIAAIRFELLDEFGTVVNLGLYQCSRIHGSTPSVWFVMASKIL
jgi:hypothetical protein